MKYFIKIIIGILLLSSCQKLEGEEIDPYIGKWKCNGIMTYQYYGYNYIVEKLEPTEECYLEISDKEVIFTNHGKKLKVFVVKFEFDEYYQTGGFTSEKLIIKTRDIRGQKREMVYFFKDGYLRGSFFSKNGFTENADWGEFVQYDYYGYHQFEKL